MAREIAYRVPRRFITPPTEPPPYGLLALSFAGHVLFFVSAVVLASILHARIDESKIYVVNLVPAAPVFGTSSPRAGERVPPTPEPVKAPPVKAAEPVQTPPAPAAPPPAKVEERTPPRPDRAELPPPRETPPPRPVKAPELLAPPRLPEIARATPVRSQELTLPRRIEKETPALDTPGARERLFERALPPTATPRLPEGARVATPRLPDPPRAAPLAPVAPPASTGVASVKPGTDPIRLGRPNVATQSTGSISLDVSDFPFTYYLRQIQAKISERWVPPRAAAHGGERVIILFEIDREGRIKEPSLERSSGNSLYDQSALRAVSEASPFPPLPPEFKAPSLRVHFGFEFQPDQG